MPCTYDGSIIQVSEKRWYWLKAFALATVRDWDALEKFSREKKPPGGMIFLFFAIFLEFLIVVSTTAHFCVNEVRKKSYSWLTGQKLA